MAKPPTRDRHRKISPENWTNPGMAMLTTNGSYISCSCGWDTNHPRPKIRDDRAEQHLNKRHGGAGLWL